MTEPAEARPNDDELVDRHKGLLSRTLLVSGLTLLSRILGYARDAFSAMLFGEGSAVLDAWITAWRVPNLFRRLFGEGALSTSLQTSLTSADGDAGRAGGAWLFQRTLLVVAALLFGVTLFGMALVFFLPDQMPVTGWSWMGDDPGPVRDLTVRLLPFVFVICLAALAGGALNVRGHYATPNLAPALMNAIWVTALIVLLADKPEGRTYEFDEAWSVARMICWVVLVGGVTQFLIQVPALLKTGLFERVDEPSTAVDRPRTVLLSALPLAFGAAVYQVNVMLDGLMAEWLLDNGGPTAHYLANRIQQFPMALIAIAATSAVFPSLTALAHRGRRQELRELFDKTQMAVAFLALPAAAGLIALARPISSLLFEHGDYGVQGVTRVARGLSMLALALPATGASVLVVRTYYAERDFKTPVVISCFTLVANVVLNVVFVGSLGMDVEGLALSTTLTGWAHLIVLYLGLERKLGLPAATVNFGRRLLPIFVASGAVWAAARFGFQALESTSPALGTAVAIAAGALAFGILSLLFRVPELDALKRRITN